MKSILFKYSCAFLASLVFISQTVWAQGHCPLLNTQLTDIRLSAAKLATQMNLSSECQRQQQLLLESGKNLKDLTDKIGDVTGLSSETDQQNAQIASQTVAQLNAINGIFKENKCGQELSGFLDYTNAFVDVVLGVSPFLALYGGPSAAPWVLGTALSGATVKVVTNYFKNRTVNMRNHEQSSLFIKNSCSFYYLNQMKSSIDDLHMQRMPRLHTDLNREKQALTQHLKIKPNKPQDPIFEEQKENESDSKVIENLEARFNNNPLESCSFIRRYVNREDEYQNESGLIARTWQRYMRYTELDEMSLTWEREFFENMLSAPLRSQIYESEKCSPLALRWLQKMKSMISLVKKKQDELISKNPNMAVYIEWDKTRIAHQESIKTLEAKLKFFQEITSSGFNIEYSEIIRSHNRVQDILFDSRRSFVMRQKGLVEAWLGVKYEDAQNNLIDFDKRRVELQKRVEDIHKTIQAPVSRDNILSFDRSYRQDQGHAHEKVHNGTYLDVCNQMRRTWLAWYEGLVHARAGRDFCIVFDNVIDKIDYPAVQRMCFATVNSQNRSQRSIRNLVSELQSKKNLADEIIKQMEDVGCDFSPEVTSEILNSKLLGVN